MKGIRVLGKIIPPKTCVTVKFENNVESMVFSLRAQNNATPLVFWPPGSCQIYKFHKILSISK